MKVSVYVCCHYGTDYLGYAIRSVIDQVDEVLVAYTPKPSHGHQTDMVCPDTREELLEIARAVAGSKLTWMEGTYHHEGLHRTAGVDECEHDLVMVLDSDEIWSPDRLAYALERVRNPNIYRHADQKRDCIPREWLVNPEHLWKSFNHICRDQMSPVRFIRKDGEEGSKAYLPASYYHMGYARSVKDIEYKISIHGHKNEWRPEWLEMFRNWKPGTNDVHPTCNDIWNPEPFDKMQLPAVLREHPYYGLDVIE